MEGAASFIQDNIANLEKEELNSTGK